jgi:hypothetical protein
MKLTALNTSTKGTPQSGERNCATLDGNVASAYARNGSGANDATILAVGNQATHNNSFGGEEDANTIVFKWLENTEGSVASLEWVDEASWYDLCKRDPIAAEIEVVVKTNEND